jgi:hypothetical protein
VESGLVGRSLGTPENLNSYAGSVSGIIYYLNENGSCMEVLQVKTWDRCYDFKIFSPKIFAKKTAF